MTLTAAEPPNTARVDTPAATGTRTLYAFSAANIGKPSSVAADQASSWAASHDGELVILSHASFMSALAPLVSRRSQEGWTVALVDLQDVYDEFGGGDKTPFAIRDFLQNAPAQWRVPPRFRAPRRRRDVRSAQLPGPRRLRLRAHEAHRHSGDGDGVRRLVRRRGPRWRAGDRHRASARAHEGRGGRRRPENARVRRRRRSAARRSLRHGPERPRRRLRGGERDVGGQGLRHHAHRSVPAQPAGRHVRGAPREARRRSVPRQLHRPRLRRALGQPAHEHAGGHAHERHETRSTSS